MSAFAGQPVEVGRLQTRHLPGEAHEVVPVIVGQNKNNVARLRGRIHLRPEASQQPGNDYNGKPGYEIVFHSTVDF
jgi:hypothetical protein